MTIPAATGQRYRQSSTTAEQHLGIYNRTMEGEIDRTTYDPLKAA